MIDFNGEALRKISASAMGPEKADRFATLLRLDLISAEDARDHLRDVLIEMPELLVTDTRAGRR